MIDALPVTTKILAYFDDSGTHKNAEITIAACILGCESDWLKLEERWNELLEKNHLEYIHSTELDDKGGQVRNQFCDIIAGSGLFGIVGSIQKNHKAEHFQPIPKKTKLPSMSNFGMCAWAVLDELWTMLAHTKGCENLHIKLFAEQDKDTARIQEILKWSIRTADKNFSHQIDNQVEARAKSDCAGIQVADLLAHKSFRDGSQNKNLSHNESEKRSTDGTFNDLKGKIISARLSPEALSQRLEKLSLLKP